MKFQISKKFLRSGLSEMLGASNLTDKPDTMLKSPGIQENKVLAF